MQVFQVRMTNLDSFNKYCILVENIFALYVTVG